jgi:NADH-quinone oxidoreductase subunit G
VARLKPRFNADVNKWWICDAGRYGGTYVDDPDRLRAAAARNGEGLPEISWAEAVAGVVDGLRRHGPEHIAVLASPRMSNEDLFALRRLVERLGVRQVAFRVPPAVAGDEDDLLIRADKNPNTRGAELVGLDGDARAILDAARAGRIRLLWVFHHDLFASAWSAAEVGEALARVEMLVFSGTNANATSARARWLLPSAAWVERDGTFTNFEGRVQRFRTAVEPLGEARPDWEMLGRALVALGDAVPATRAEHWFAELARTVAAFAGMTYRSIGDAGLMVPAPEAAPR